MKDGELASAIELVSQAALAKHKQLCHQLSIAMTSGSGTAEEDKQLMSKMSRLQHLVRALKFAKDEFDAK